MDLPGSACAPRFTYISTAFGCHTISSDYQSRTVRQKIPGVVDVD